MRTPGLQYLYLQKPLTLILLIATFSVLPWIKMGGYYTKGEPREAAVAVSILKGNVVVPNTYADELTYKPPLVHWLTAAFSLPKGEVTPFTSRLPSALAFIAMVGVCFMFFGRKLTKGHEAFIACLIMITCFELHRAAMTSRVDMLLTSLTVTGLVALFFWAENKKLKGLPWYIPLILACATLVKGMVGAVLPLLIFGIYLLITRHNFLLILRKTVLVGLLSIIPLFIWYYLAYLSEGKEFVDLMWAENFGRLLGLKNLNIQYHLGHEVPFWHNFLFLFSGFLPWTLLMFFSLFGIKLAGKIPGIKTVADRISAMDRVKLFSLVAAVVIFIFYCIPISHRSVYLMPAYPFIAIFMAQYMLYLAEYKSKIFRAFSIVLACLVAIPTLVALMTLTGVVQPKEIAMQFTQDGKTLFYVSAIAEALYSISLLYIILLLGLLYGLSLLIYYLTKNNNLKILYAVFGLYMALNLFLDGICLPGFKNKMTLKPFATELKSKYPLSEDNMYVMNNLLIYNNMYGLNFYLGNSFQNFEKALPESGYFFVVNHNMGRIQEAYGDRYQFTFLEETPDGFNDARNIIQLYRIERK